MLDEGRRVALTKDERPPELEFEIRGKRQEAGGKR